MPVDLEICELDEVTDYPVYTVALFISWEEGVGRGFAFQRELLPDSDPRAEKPPFNVYCVVNERHKTSLGGVVSATWDGNALEFVFAKDAVQELELPSRRVSLVLNLTPDNIESALRGLVKVFSYGPADLLPELNGFPADS